MKTSRIIASVATAAILAFAPLSAMAQQDIQPCIEQSAKAERKVTPDELYISITINEKDNKGKVSVEKQQNAMIKALQQLGIDVEKNLTLNFMDSQVSYSTFRRNITPRTTATYMLKLDNAEIMQKVISKLEEKDITNIQLVTTRYSKADELYNELGIEAMKKAQSQAATLAEAVGQSIGAAININSWNSSNGGAQPRLYKSRATMAENAAIEDSAEPVIEIGKLTFSVNVNVKFILKEGKE
ncbi:MAG: SIMPL domain-containing protein [Bacteroidaceae bacterium]|nr:SIMPL domain-containing protein [Bacteroidaceae bacterium]